MTCSFEVAAIFLTQCSVLVRVDPGSSTIFTRCASCSHDVVDEYFSSTKVSLYKVSVRDSLGYNLRAGSVECSHVCKTWTAIIPGVMVTTAHPPSRSPTGTASLLMTIPTVDLLQVFDPTESAGVGLLDEMSHMETKARLEANRRHRAKAEAERRKDIIIERAERQADLRERQALLSRRCPPRAASTLPSSPGIPCPQTWTAFVACAKASCL